MEIRVDRAVVHYVEHGTGRPVLVLHGAGVDHREAEACFEPALGGVAGLRRIYPDLPGMGCTTAPDTLRSGDDVLAPSGSGSQPAAPATSPSDSLESGRSP